VARPAAGRLRWPSGEKGRTHAQTTPRAHRHPGCGPAHRRTDGAVHAGPRGYNQRITTIGDDSRFAGTLISRHIYQFFETARLTEDSCNQYSGKCLDVASASTADGANIIQYTCQSGATNQQWRMQAGGSYFQLVARHSGKCLDVLGAGTGDGVDIDQYTCNSGTNQQWSRTAA
jgi:hypothetical protein